MFILDSSPGLDSLLGWIWPEGHQVMMVGVLFMRCSATRVHSKTQQASGAVGIVDGAQLFRWSVCGVSKSSLLSAWVALCTSAVLVLWFSWVSRASQHFSLYSCRWRMKEWSVECTAVFSWRQDLCVIPFHTLHLPSSVRIWVLVKKFWRKKNEWISKYSPFKYELFSQDCFYQ